MRSLSRILCLIPISLATLLSASCSIISEEQCLQEDWHYIGYADGERGFNPDARLYSIDSECSAYGVTLDRDLYREGHQLGLRRYCTPANAYLLGENGDNTEDLCPADLRPAFIANYLSGLTLNMNSLSYKVTELNATLRAAELTYDELLASDENASGLEEAQGYVRYNRWWLEYYKFLLRNTESKIVRWSTQLP